MQGELGSFSFDVVKRLLDKVYGKDLNRTNLASASGINYNTLVRYLGILCSLGWTSINESGLVSITPLGLEVRRRLAAGLSPTDSNDADRANFGLDNIDKKSGVVKQRKTGSLRPFADKLETQQNNQDAAGQPYNVIIVDDEPEVALTYKMFLKSTGRYNTEAFTEPSIALRNFAAKMGRYDLAVLDIRMPGINGIQLYQSMAAMNPRCRFLFVSSLDAAAELLSIFPKITTDEIIRKPVGKDRFVQTVDRLLKYN